MSKINSHIQMPRSILSNFENEHNVLYYYDFNDSRIKRGHSKSLNTEQDYYSEGMEKHLCTNIEHPFSETLRKIKSFNIGERLILTESDLENILHYLYALMARSFENLDALKKNSIFSIMYSDRFIHDFLIQFSLERFEHTEFLADSDITFGINTTDIPFVLPISGYCETNGVVYLPVSPTIVIMIVYKNQEQYVYNNKPLYTVFDKRESVDGINRLFFISEKSNKRYVAATTRKQLVEIASNLQSEGILELKIEGQRD